jgi:hypothetical protein
MVQSHNGGKTREHRAFPLRMPCKLLSSSVNPRASRAYFDLWFPVISSLGAQAATVSAIVRNRQFGSLEPRFLGTFEEARATFVALDNANLPGNTVVSN